MDGYSPGYGGDSLLQRDNENATEGSGKAEQSVLLQVALGSAQDMNSALGCWGKAAIEDKAQAWHTWSTQALRSLHDGNRHHRLMGVGCAVQRLLRARRAFDAFQLPEIGRWCSLGGTCRRGYT